jgi:hypothetical protein
VSFCCHYAKCNYAEGHYADCHFAECRNDSCPSFMLSVVMLSVIMLNVVGHLAYLVDFPYQLKFCSIFSKFCPKLCLLNIVFVL